MFWNDIEEIKAWMQSAGNRLTMIDHKVEKLLGHVQEDSSGCLKCDSARAIENGLENVKEVIVDLLCSPDENNSINRILDKLDALLSDASRAGEVLVAEKTLEKFEDYMKNVDKVNSMINEFKGCVAMCRASIAEGNVLSKTIEEMKKVADISQHIHKSMLSFIRAGDNMEKTKFFKIDAIYKAICESQEKKSPKRRKAITKKATPAP